MKLYNVAFALAAMPLLAVAKFDVNYWTGACNTGTFVGATNLDNTGCQPIPAVGGDSIFVTSYTNDEKKCLSAWTGTNCDGQGFLFTVKSGSCLKWGTNVHSAKAYSGC
ncbi:hypothetical protein BT69DRAFT_1283933 [Atractiella rhizophila]|nr:hypothetical protein BT69DRAFT_1283933 [Atractiella rhizophila]